MKAILALAVTLVTVVLVTSNCVNEQAAYVALSHSDVEPKIEAVIEFLAAQNFADNPDWRLFPEKDAPKDGLKRLGLPIHGRWVKTFVNETAYKFLTQAVTPDIVQPMEFPPGSFIVKQNFRNKFGKDVPIEPALDSVGVITVLYKPDPKFNYCATPHLKPYNSVDCLGGNWFYGFFFPKQMKKEPLPERLQQTVDSVNANIPSFCVNCHAPAFNTDYVRTLDNERNPFSVASKTPYCDRFRDGDPKGNLTVESPADLEELRRQVITFNTNFDLSSTLPGDVPADPTLVFKFMGADATQRMFDTYAWKSFIALNWPNKNGQRGVPNTEMTFSGNETSPTVWETYKATFEVFQPGTIDWNPVDQPWNDAMPEFAPPSCQDVDYDFVITMASKTRDVANETGQAFAGSFGYLVDQNKNRVRYEVLFNQTEFEYLIGEGRAASLNLTPSGPKGLENKVRFPDTRTDTVRGQGSIEIKSAWKELCVDESCKQRDGKNRAEAEKRYLVRDALIYDSETKTCRTAPMALVGLHIARKTYYAPQWIWITFEHKDNVPDAGAENPTGTFFDPALAKEAENMDCYQYPFLYPFPKVKDCPNVDLNRFMPELGDAPNQLTRLIPIDSIANERNLAFQEELKKIDSPFANYILVDTQWPLNGRGQDGLVNTLNCKDNGMGDDCFTMVPRFLRNSVIESYMATYCEVDGKPKQVSNRSCMSCHGSAGADMSYVFLDAVSQRIELKSDED
ncbi:MAG: hypothetical protein AAF466_06265 [Bacteroidota bacterium]